MSTQPRKTSAKKAAAKKTTVTQEPDPQQEQAAPGVAIANQAAFAQALGLNPESILPNSMRIEFNQQGVALVIFTAAMGVNPQQLAYAFMASSGMMGDGADGQPTPIPTPDPEGDETE